ncbi:high affinity immunoglobulin gamma Fc receptor I-like isoform X2 [Pungitius pungitius]|uniref:high affinity immunoglobulin gamma Fc receptor I-like isoform X2 n=1 Tax=Pungitius pungitius TaxID=134920 RepID=UPI002E10DF32
MEVTALCFTLMVELLVLLVDPCCFAQRPALPRVLPDRLQFFEYESVSVDCAESSGSTDWRVMRKQNQTQPKRSKSWNSSSPSVSIHPAFSYDSGEYWCEDAEGSTSDALNITVTDGSVILDVPARPVEEGGHLILRCEKKDDLKPIADFYRDGSHLGTRYDATLTVTDVSEEDAGLYWCSVSGAGDSPRSRLGVRNQTAADVETRPTPTTPTHLICTHPPPPHSSPCPQLGVVVGVLVGAPLLLLGGLLLCRNHEAEAEASSAGPLEETLLYSTAYYR